MYLDSQILMKQGINIKVHLFLQASFLPLFHIKMEEHLGWGEGGRGLIPGLHVDFRRFLAT